MKKSHLTLGLCLSFATSSAALASMDMDSCAWASPGCFLVSPPVLGVANDTRDNLLRLLDEQKGLSSLRQPVRLTIRIATTAIATTTVAILAKNKPYSDSNSTHSTLVQPLNNRIQCT